MATFALIHGGGDHPRSWHLLEAELRSRGHETIAVRLPSEDESAGLSEYADAVVDAIGERPDRELVVVAHSFGGLTAPLVCERIAVDRLVLVAAMVPRPGETGMEYFSENGLEEAAAKIDHDGSDIAIYYHDVDPELAAEAIAGGQPQSGTPAVEPWPLAAWPDVPTHYLLARGDRCFPAEWSRRMVRERLHIEADEIDGGHCVFLSRPGELADRLVSYLGAPSPQAAG